MARRAPIKWTEAMVTQLRSLVADPRLDWPAVGAALGLSEQAARHKAMRLGINKGGPSRLAHARPIVQPVISSPAPPARSGAELWQAARKDTKRDVERAQQLRIVDVTIPDTLPIGISAISDQHIRQSGPVDLDRMEEDAGVVRETGGLYALLGGDGADNHVKHRAAMAAGGSAPRHEWTMYDHYLSMFRVDEGFSKILAMVSGNHDEFGKDQTGIDEVAKLAKANAIHYAPDEILVRLTLGKATYRIKVRHQYRFGSAWNLLHTVHRLWDMGDDDFDIGVVCHQHQGTVGSFDRHGRTIYAARPGSYQITSGYGRRYGFKLTRPTCPTFILDPERFKITPFDDVRDAAFHLTALRAHRAQAA